MSCWKEIGVHNALFPYDGQNQIPGEFAGEAQENWRKVKLFGITGEGWQGNFRYDGAAHMSERIINGEKTCAAKRTWACCAVGG